MLTSRIYIVLMIAVLLAGAVPLTAQTVAAKADEGKLIAVLKSNDASHKDKVDACRQLAIIGGKDSVSPLAALLGDEKLSHMARYALERNPDRAVDEALREALGKLKGKPLVGVIGSIGVRRDAEAVEPLKSMLMKHEAGPEATEAAMRALGSIGTPAAAEVLKTALGHAPDDSQLALYEGLFRCAERLAAEGSRRDAIQIYDQLRNVDTAHQVRGGALRGAILTRRPNGQLKLLQEHLRSDDYILFSAAVQTALEIPGDQVTKALTDAMSGLSADHQIVLIQALSLRGDSTALFAAAGAGETPVRLTAIQALARIGDVGAVPVLVKLLDDGDRQIAQAAQENLAALPGTEPDAAVVAMFKTDDVDKQLMAIELMGRRRMTGSIDPLLTGARQADARVRPAAIKMIGELGGPAQLPGLLDLLAQSEAPPDLDAARQALSDVCGKAEAPESCAPRLIARLEASAPAQKIVLLRVLSGIGGADALKAVRAAVDDTNAEVHVAAIRALGTWKTADAAPDLLALAKAASDASDRTLCLRAYLGLARRGDVPTAQRLAICRGAGDMIQRDDEKRLLLGTLSNIESPETLALITPHLDDADVRQEAALAALGVAERLLKQRDNRQYAPALIEPLEKVVQSTTDSDLAGRAKTLLRQARNRAGN